MDERRRAERMALRLAHLGGDEAAAVAGLLMDVAIAWEHVAPELRLRHEQHQAAAELNGRLDFDQAAHVEADAGRGPCPFGGFGVCGYCTERAAGPEVGR